MKFITYLTKVLANPRYLGLTAFSTPASMPEQLAARKYDQLEDLEDDLLPIK